ncbi:glycosyltransferase family 4 protein [Nakamurella alba]|uniref:glycosyltransferase family 4 protein n=1 Tax=Nakamurella alba TaxID=2665158 RepID=UPI0012B85CF8
MTPPRILLDATAIPAERGGVGRYVDQLAAALDARGADLAIACQHGDAEIMQALAPHSRIVPVAEELRNRPARLAWEQTTLPRLARRVAAQVIHSPHYTMPLAAGLPVVSTLHDATFFSDRNLHLGVKGRFFRSWTRVSLRRAAVCVVPSRATADELVRLAGARTGRLVVAHHGVDTGLFHPPAAADVQAFADDLDLPTGWVAFLGTVEPRKNVPALIRGFVRAVAGRTDPPALVLAGSPGWDHAVDPAIAAVPPGVRVLRTGHLPLDRLPALLGGATVVAYPSLGEGFGLPVLEAMACRATVLTTRRLSLPEVGGDAVAYTGTGAGDIGDALAGLLDYPARRTELADLAVERAAGFTWDACAEKHEQAYRRAAATR